MYNDACKCEVKCSPTIEPMKDVVDDLAIQMNIIRMRACAIDEKLFGVTTPALPEATCVCAYDALNAIRSVAMEVAEILYSINARIEGDRDA